MISTGNGAVREDIKNVENSKYKGRQGLFTINGNSYQFQIQKS